ncbi:MAG: ribosome small subunit-dependent GTPase A [Desulfatibacillum sp.]|nr:ribosome small subunit-dependent GTPase A [Desulfatibacillum sp.]
MSLKDLGWNGFFENNYLSLENPDWKPARVTGVRKNQFVVNDGVKEFAATASGRLFHAENPDALFPAAGDWVAMRDNVIVSVLPRKNSLSRGASGRRFSKFAAATQEQVIAANLDTVFITCGLDREFNLRRIERFLTLIFNCGCTPVVILNKADIHPAPEECVAEVESVALGVPVHAISAFAGLGMESIRQYLLPGHTVALIGSSGVGKSTLVNHLLGQDIQATRQISESVGKGVHTTTTRDIISIPGAGMILDNPGIREIALWEDTGRIGDTFPEIQALSQECRFGDCSHMQEPGCRVREAVATGDLPQNRLESFLKMQRELDFMSQRQEKSANRVEKERWKDIAMLQKSMKSNKK